MKGNFGPEMKNDNFWVEGWVGACRLEEGWWGWGGEGRADIRLRHNKY